MILDLLYREQDISAQHGPRHEIEHRIAAIQGVGYACMHHPGPPSDRSSLAVPVRTANGTLAALAVRFARSAVGQQVIMERLLPALRTTAHAIVARFDASAAAPPLDALQHAGHQRTVAHAASRVL